jgi:hypothetical protein
VEQIVDLTCCIYYFTGIKSNEERSYSFYYSRKGRQKWYDILFVPTNMISNSTNSNTYINKRQKNFTSKVVLLNNYMFYHNHNSLSLLQPVNDCMFLLLLGFFLGGGMQDCLHTQTTSDDSAALSSSHRCDTCMNMYQTLTFQFSGRQFAHLIINVHIIQYQLSRGFTK